VNVVRLETVRVLWPNRFSGPVNINVESFDEKVHTKCDADGKPIGGVKVEAPKEKPIRKVKATPAPKKKGE